MRKYMPFFSFNDMGIAVKTSLVSSFVVLVLLATIAGVILSMESKMVEHIIDSFAAKEMETTRRIVKEEKLALAKRHKVNVKICAGLAAPFVYNFEQEELATFLKTFLSLPDIVAISVTDAENKPFSAIWRKDNEILSADKLEPGMVVDEKLSFVEDILMGGEKIGLVRLYFTDELINKVLEDNKNESRQSVELFRKSIDARASKDLTIKIFAFSVVIVVLVCTIFLTLKAIVLKPLHRVTLGLKDIAQGEGDLTKRLESKSKDEVGELAKWFDQFIGKVHEIITGLAQGTDKLDHSSETLKRVSAHMTVNADHASEKTREVSERFVSVSKTMASVANEMEEASSNISTVAAATEEMTATITEISSSTGKANTATADAVEYVGMATQQVGELDLAAQQIGKVLETITDISDQVNLLSLNATIEAARAGEAGKGFAVVAGEIKTLAVQTSEATSEIKSRVDSIQSATGVTIDKIKSISTIVNDVDQIVSTIAAAVEEQSATTQEIAGNVGYLSESINNVNQDVADSNTAISDIAIQIVQVTKTSDDISSESSKVSTNAEDLAELSRHQSEVVNRFKI